MTIDNTTNNLSWQESNSMQFADVIVDGLTQEGMTCNTSTITKERNLLCPGNKDLVSNAVFIVSGSANETVNVLVDIMPIVTNGIRFAPVLINGNTLVLDQNGSAVYELGGELTLLDINANINVTYSYNVEFSTQ